jgi:hypothetical protein
VAGRSYGSVTTWRSHGRTILAPANVRSKEKIDLQSSGRFWSITAALRLRGFDPLEMIPDTDSSQLGL